MFEGLGTRGVFFGRCGGLLYAGNAGIVPKSPDSFVSMMEPTVKASTAFGLMVSVVKTDIMYQHENDRPTVEFSVHAAGRLHKQRNALELCMYWRGGGGITDAPDVSTVWRSGDECSERAATTASS